MLAALLGAVRADLNRQVGWAREEARRQIRHAMVVGAIGGAAALAALGALIVGLITLHSWLAPQVGSFAALGMIGAGLLLLMLILLLVAFSLRRPGLKTRPGLQIVQPVALFRTDTSFKANQAIAAGEDSLRLATGTLREGGRSQLLGMLALIAVAGMIAGRRLRRARPQDK
jgi:MFS family permease